MWIKQRPDNWSKETVELHVTRKCDICSDEDLFDALSSQHKKPIKQRPNNWPKEAVVLAPKKE